MLEKKVEYGTEVPVKVISANDTLIIAVSTDLFINEGYAIAYHGLSEIPKPGDLGKVVFEHGNQNGHWQYYPLKN